MYVFKFSPALLDSIRNEGVIQLFTVLIENITVSFNRRDSSDLVDVGENFNQ